MNKIKQVFLDKLNCTLNDEQVEVLAKFGVHNVLEIVEDKKNVKMSNPYKFILKVVGDEVKLTKSKPTNWKAQFHSLYGRFLEDGVINRDEYHIIMSAWLGNQVDKNAYFLAIFKVRKSSYPKTRSYWLRGIHSFGCVAEAAALEGINEMVKDGVDPPGDVVWELLSDRQYIDEVRKRQYAEALQRLKLAGFDRLSKICGPEIGGQLAASSRQATPSA